MTAKIFFKALWALAQSLFLIVTPFTFPRVPHEKKLELVWSDEFDGDTLDETKWEGHYCNAQEASVRRGFTASSSHCSRVRRKTGSGITAMPSFSGSSCRRAFAPASSRTDTAAKGAIHRRIFSALCRRRISVTPREQA